MLFYDSRSNGHLLLGMERYKTIGNEKSAEINFDIIFCRKSFLKTVQDFHDLFFCKIMTCYSKYYSIQNIPLGDEKKKIFTVKKKIFRQIFSFLVHSKLLSTHSKLLSTHPKLLSTHSKLLSTHPKLLSTRPKLLSDYSNSCSVPNFSSSAAKISFPERRNHD